MRAWEEPLGSLAGLDVVESGFAGLVRCVAFRERAGGGFLVVRWRITGGVDVETGRRRVATEREALDLLGQVLGREPQGREPE